MYLIRKSESISLIIILIIASISFVNPTLAQTTNYNDPNQQQVLARKVIPPSPEVAAFGKYGDIPVSNYTGVPDISIPIFSFTAFGKTFPIGLNYHAGGIKVDEVSSNVGLGWTLSAGGVVGCTIQGMPDFEANGYVRADRQITSTFNPNPTINDGSYQMGKDLLNGDLDGEPDIYFFNFPGHSGKFVYDQNGVPRLIPNNTKINIQKTSSGFTIADEDGTIYNFNNSELSTTTTDNQQCPTPLSLHVPTTNQSYFLSSITYRNQDVIYLQYETYSYQYKNNPTETSYTPYPDNYYCNTITPNPKVCPSISSFITPRIKSITYKDLTISFSYSTTDRLDLHGANSLQSIVISNSSKTLHIWNFKYDYFKANYSSCGQCITAGASSQLDQDTYYKLKLTSVTEDSQPSYSFEYNENNGQFPNRLSNARDYWGYFNGRGDANGSLLPTLNTEVGLLNGIDRNSYEGFAKTGTLSRITYPTGGSTQFEYENNNYYGCQALTTIKQYAVSALASSDISSTTATSSFDITPNDINIMAQYSQGTSSTQFSTMLILRGPNNYQQSFTGDSPNGGQSLYGLPIGHYTITATSMDTNPAGYLTIGWQRKVDSSVCQNWLGGGIRIKRITNYTASQQTPVNVKRYDYISPSDVTKSSGFIVNPPNYGETQLYPRINSLGNEYTVIYTNPCRYFVRTAASTVPLGDIQGANVGYEYVTVYNEGSTDNGKSLYQYTTYDDLHNNQYVYPYASPTSNDWIRGLLLQQTDYKNVNNSYKKVRQVINSYTINNNYSSMYDYQNNPYVNETNVLGVKVGCYIPETINGAQGATAGGQVIYAQFVLAFFKYTSGWYYLNKSEVTTFDQNETNPVLETSYYFYDNPTHLQLTRTAVIKSDGRAVSSLTTYPDDYLSNTTFIADMQSNHLVNYPIEQISWIDNSINTSTKANILSGEIKTYKTGGVGLIDNIFKLETIAPIPLTNFKFSNSIVGQLPYSHAPQLFENDTHYKLRFVYDQYDISGNPLQLTPATGPSTTYLWGYNKRYPIAQISNANYLSVITALSNAGINADNVSNQVDISSTDISKIRSVLQSALPNAHVTTYTYSPLVGMTSMTDAKGMTTYYEYDGFQRLMNIKDKDGNIVKHMDYHYQGSN